MADPSVNDLLVLEKEGVVMYDAYLGEDVLVIAPVLCALADNPRASDFVSHGGTSARKFCRMCQVASCIICSHMKAGVHIGGWVCKS